MPKKKSKKEEASEKTPPKEIKAKNKTSKKTTPKSKKTKNNKESKKVKLKNDEPLELLNDEQEENSNGALILDTLAEENTNKKEVIFWLHSVTFFE